ncbi:WecB/TagA/CpsF family glycosyltransferase [Flavobacterium filum]|uniref:WecB/TagA/CpsF family glycosyltransferase n=1 Tax=Flavobacterium filum TaxID=370974 RepID=UPI0023F4873C|nr:WecB/TagA/CpsF family glycosyltransferase [Flavobacterium filum]
MPIKNIDLFGIRLNDISYAEILDSIQKTIENQNQQTICYVNVNSINLSILNDKIKNLFSEFNIVHADGFGVFLGSKILYGKDGLSHRLNGSDLYEKLIYDCIRYNYKLFFFGDRDEALIQIKRKQPQINVVGVQNGFEFDSTSIVNKINQAVTDILIVGMGTPKQEEWINRNKRNLKVSVIISVGDGIKVFSGTKRRGLKIFQKLGLEWMVRLFYEPKRLWKRYLIGIPLFIFKVIKYKFMILKIR